MKVIAVNGSPRKNWNTDILLKKALEGAQSKGADTEIIHLYDLNFKGCTSCFACKVKNSKYIGRCAMKDELTSVLEKISECDSLILGSPIYLGNITGEMRSFLERLIFPNSSYNLGVSSVYKGKISTGFIYTMNGPKWYAGLKNYKTVFNCNKHYLKKLNGISEILLSSNTYQFSDYSKYEASKFNEKRKAKVKEEKFPKDCQKAFEMGIKLVEI